MENSIKLTWCYRCWWIFL